jgi:multidrug efflux system membrane fusion protein
MAKKWMVVGAAVVLVGGAVVVAKATNKQKPKEQESPFRLGKTQVEDLQVSVREVGVVDPEIKVDVKSAVSGRLVGLNVREGDVVQKGQVLFHIDPRPLQAVVDQARATLARDEAQAEAAATDEVRYQRLADMGYVSRSQADQMRAASKAAAATVDADRANLRAALVDLGFATIRAPIAGRTGSLLVRQGNNVGPGGSPLVVINQLSPVLVRFPVLSQDLPTLRRAVAAGTVTVHASGGDSSDVSDELGTLGFIDNAIDSLTGTVAGKAEFRNSGNRLWPGELVFLTVQVSVQRGVIAVPTEAIQTGQQGTYVYVVDAASAAKQRTVATGIPVGDLTVVKNGLTVGERVVIDGQSKLNPGARVAIVSGRRDTASTTIGGDTAQRSAAGEIAPSAGTRP